MSVSGRTQTIKTSCISQAERLLFVKAAVRWQLRNCRSGK